MIWQSNDANNRQLIIVRPNVVFGKSEKVKWSFEEALKDWFEDNEKQGLK